MLPQEFIRLQRDKRPLPPYELQAFIKGVADGSVTDPQIAAFCMAVLLNGLSIDDTAQLTMAMAASGIILQWGDLNGRVIDKHSSGGVGDKVSLMLAPVAAACGLYVPMIAGRGLGHTGGTIDKLETIPGYNTAISLDKFQNTVRAIGCSIIGQTKEFAPADKRMYAVRDISGAVESSDLITASILSKKLAAGLNGLVLDVKCGNGAFMDDVPKAKALANSLQSVANAAGLKLVPVITDMNQVLGSTAGNSVEVMEAVDYLTGAHREKRLHDITMHLAAEMIVLGGITSDFAGAHAMAEHALNSGKATEIFAQMVTHHGGPKDFIENAAAYLGQAPIVRDIVADRDGYISAMQTRDIGVLLVQLKAGRSKVEDSIDPHIGLTDIMPIGKKCEAGKTVLARVHLRNDSDFTMAAGSYLKCLTIGDAPPQASNILCALDN